MSLFNRPLFATLLNPINSGNFGATQIRTLKSALKIKWVRPVKKPHIHPSNTGDRASLPAYNSSSLMLAFSNSKELQSADDSVKRIFQLDLNNALSKWTLYKKELGDKVRRHAYDNTSHEIYIANLTARIRYLQDYLEKSPKDTKMRVQLQHCIDKRKRQLSHLRRWDYKRFEWILEKLDLEYRPYPDIYDQITRKKSLTTLTTLHCEEIKETRIGEYRKKMDEQKVSFLEEKLKKLEWIRQREEKFNMEKTVSTEDIADCGKQLEKAMLEAKNIKNKKYTRDIDPYTLEVYDSEALRAAEMSEKPEEKEEINP